LFKQQLNEGVMSTILKFLGGFLLIAIIIAAAASGVAWYKARALQRDGSDYVETNLPLIVANWNADEVISRAAPEFLVPSVREGLPKAFQVFSQLGKLRKLGKPKGVVTFADYQFSLGDHEVPMPPKFPDPIWARYVVDAAFDARSASVMLDLQRRNERWQIVGFFIKPE
jgi:hypothetical protein